MKFNGIKNKKELLYLLFIILFILFLFQDFLQEVIPAFKYLDELYIVLILPILIIELLKMKKSKSKKNFFKSLPFSLIILFLIGILSNIIYKIQPISVAFKDIVGLFKFFIALNISKYIFRQLDLKDKSLFLGNLLSSVVILLFLLTILHYFCIESFTYEIRYGLKATELFYSHPTYLNSACMILISLFLILDYKYSKINICALLLIMITTLRSKAIVFVAIFIFLYYVIIIKHKRLNWKILCLIAIFGVAISFNQIKYYFFSNMKAAREVLLVNSFKVANDYFPLGAGFGTYGSAAAGSHYSQIYYDYDMDEVFGLEPFNPQFASDSFWPMLIGQFGYIGTICYILALLSIFVKIWKIKDDKLHFVALMIFMYLLLSSLTESSFCNYYAVPLAMLLGVNLLKAEEQ